MTAVAIGLADLLRAHPAADGDPVLHWKDGALTLAELRERAGGLAARLTGCGVGPGAPVASVVGRGVDAVVAMFGTWLAGGVHVPLNGRGADAELAAHLAATSPAVVLAGVGDVARLPAGVAVSVASEAGEWTGPGTDRVAGGAAASYPADAALVMRTSGTTGEPKPVVLRHGGVLDGIDTVIARLRGGRNGSGRPPMPNLVPTSLALWAGIWNTLFAFRLGAPVVLLDRFDPLDYAALVKRFGIRSTVLAPAMMTMLAEDTRVTDLAPLAMVRSITAPLTPAQARRFHDRFGVAVLNSYGQTELGSEVVGWTAADLRAYGETKLGSVGRPHPGVDVRVLDDAHVPVGDGGSGEVWVRSPFASEQADPERMVDGYLRTGDLGRLDADGFLWIEGRVSDMVNRGGLKVVPQEVEDVLRRHPSVFDACVAGVPDERLGEVPVAWVRPVPGASVDTVALLSFARAQLAGYKVPVAVEVVAEFPRSEIGKVLRRRLVTSYRAGGSVSVVTGGGEGTGSG